jgi:CHAT domain-containing protein/Tfp pilus assembly protein PilF
LAKWGKYEEAIGVQQRRMAWGDRLGYPDAEADAICDMGYVHNGYDDEYEKAIPFYKKSYELHMELADTTMATLSLSNTAQSYWSLKNLDQSIEYHLATIALAEAYGEKDRIAHSWDKLADLYSENGNPKKSLEAYDRVLAIYKELGDDRYLVTLNEIGDVYRAAKDYQKAISYYQLNIKEARQYNEYIAASDGLFDLANLYYERNQYDSAAKYFTASMDVAAGVDYPSQEIYCLANLALIYSLQNEHERSDDIYTEALEKAQALGDNNIIAFCKYRLAGTATRKMNYASAEQLYRESLTMYKELNDVSMQISLLYAISWMHSNRGEFDKAIELIDRGILMAEENGDRNNEAYGYNSKADIFLRVKGEFDKALEIQEKSVDIFQEVDNSWGIAQAYIGMGNINNLAGENVEAIYYYKKADSLYRQLGNEYSRATPVNNMGTIYFAQADYERALEYFHEALNILDKLQIKDSFVTLIAGNIGEVKLEQRAFDEAEEWLMKSLEEARSIDYVEQISTSLVLMGRVKIETGDYHSAEKYLQEAWVLQKDKGMKTHRIATGLSLGKLAYLQKDEGNYHYLDQCISISEDMGYEKELWEAYYYKGLAARDAGQLEESKEYFIDAIEAMEALQSKMVGGEEAKKLFASGDKQVKVYSSLIDLLILKGEVELGMQYLERGNMEALRNKFNQMDITFRDDGANEKLQKERELKRRLDNLERAITEEKAGEIASAEKIEQLQQNMSVAEDEYLKFVNRTIQTDPKLAQHFSGGFHPRNLKTDKNRRLIPDELLVLSYLPGNDKLYIFAATSDTVVAKIVQVKLEELNKNIRFLHNFASHAISGHNTDRLRVARGEEATDPPQDYNPEESLYKEISEKLFNWVIAPVREQLDAKEEVVVIPTGMLHFLPFQMLGENKPNGKFDYLIEHYTLFYAHSLNMLYQQRPRDPEISILAMANADKSLPAAEEEVKDLKALYPDTEVYLHDNASEDKAKSYTGRHNILHFATHGNLDYYDYHKSYLTLAPSGEEDGKLTIEEVWEIEDIYSYQMVTLSACKTAVAEEVNTGWAVSPATSFIDAGAPTVVASLWAVNDQSTGILMRYFYENLKTMSKVEALRRAQIKLTQDPKYSHPYYWAPFILIGDWR